MPTLKAVPSLPLLLTILVGVPVLCSCRSPATVPDGTTEFMIGADLSMLTRVEQLGGVYRDGGEPRDGLAIFRSRGFNWIRLRIFHCPNGRGGTVNDLDYTLALAQRARGAGFRFLLDFHYSDTWADPGKQYKPAAWDTLPFQDLVTAVRDYSRNVISAFKREDVLPDMVQIGNEIRNGMLWPDGRVGGEGEFSPVAGVFDTPEQWAQLTALVNAGVQGVRDALGQGDSVAIMVQSDNGGSRLITRWFFDNLLRRNVEFDVIGLSYYPRWHGPLDSLRANLSTLPHVYDKDVVLVECAYPWKAAADEQNIIAGYPATSEGQRAYLEELARIVRHMPDGRGAGIFYWAPEWIPVNGRGPSGRLALFDDDGESLPGLAAFLYSAN